MSGKEILSLSPSGLVEFIGCPRKYHYKYTAKIPEPEISEKTSYQWLSSNERGTMMHRVMELYVKKVILPHSDKLDTMEATHGSAEESKIVTALHAITFSEKEFETVWKQAVNEIELALQKKSDEAQVTPLSAKEKELAEAENECKNAIKYLLDNMKERQQYPVMVEMKFGKRKGQDGNELRIQRSGEEDFVICGSIDRVDYDVITGKYVVVDYKTGQIDQKRKLREGGRDDLLQDRMYALAFEKINPEKEVMASRYVFLSEDNQEIFEPMTVESKAIFLDRLWEEVQKIRTKTDQSCKENEAEYPDCKYTCDYCAYSELCTASDELDVLTMAISD